MDSIETKAAAIAEAKVSDRMHVYACLYWFSMIWTLLFGYGKAPR